MVAIWMLSLLVRKLITSVSVTCFDIFGRACMIFNTNEMPTVDINMQSVLERISSVLINIKEDYNVKGKRQRLISRFPRINYELMTPDIRKMVEKYYQDGRHNLCSE